MEMSVTINAEEDVAIPGSNPGAQRVVLADLRPPRVTDNLRPQPLCGQHFSTHWVT
jgi:hypothetical protein